MGEISVKTGNNARNGGKNSLNRLIRCVCGKKIGPDPRNFNQRVSLGRNDLLIRTFPNGKKPGDHAGIYTGKNKAGIPLYISGNTVSTNPVVTDETSSYVDEHQMKHFNYAARFW
ncbi:hypothetical protein [Klebsiella quasipneumoniae]|uniref:hypothetical protein n=1 Tax=Klebsiella quasipneumoniae TaxID=1463165 RepID=UPI001E5E3058|nr:hypothetical protein [Klebsiella quasipneumoniae]